MNILICDDIHDEALCLEDAVRASGFEAQCRVFSGVSGAKDALTHIRSGAKIDVCFLDILMPGMSGVELAEELRRDQYSGEIVFCTTTNEYASESYEVEAFSYLLKPPNALSVAGILREIEGIRKKADTAGIHIQTRNLIRFLLFHEISYVEVIGRKIYFRLLGGGEIAVNATFGEIASVLLEDKRFAQCHRAYIVNMDEVSHIEDNVVSLRCGRKALISNVFAGFRKKYCAWIFRVRTR